MFVRSLLLSIAIALSSLAVADEAAIKVNAVVHSVAGDKINVSHDPIPEIGWPAMTMDMDLASDVDTSAIPTESPVVLELTKGDDGIYQVKTVTAAE